MPLSTGARLGPYEIVAPLGVGGMGEVFRARDTRLERDVAIKILPEAFALDAGRVARFQREAKALASLNHPHIAAIYGLEEAAGVTALVMELVEGEDLSQRLAHGAIPLDGALPIARQIAEALEAAHEQGIIHRDLKPANIKVRADGTVKVLDFGLAKAMEPAGGAPKISQSPTITTPAMMTGVGVLLGTAAYMSPEQARGKVVDKRTDLWAFGCVLYEMLTGARPFVGDDVTETIAAVVRADPDWSKLSPDTPAAIRRLLRRSLEKDRVRRLPDAADARLEIDEALHPAASDANIQRPASTAVTVVAGWQDRLWWGVTAALAVGLSVALVLWAPWRAVAPPRVTRTTITFSGAAALMLNGSGRDIALTLDGTHIVYVGNNGSQLFVRALDALEPMAIASASAGIRDPFVSADGQWAGFVSSNNFSLEKVAITGGAPMTIARVDGVVRGATWAADDAIIFATENAETGLQRVSAHGGAIEVLTRPDHQHGEADHLWPEFLPGGRAVLFTITSQTGGLDSAQVVVRDLRTGTQTVVLHGGSDAHYVTSGHLVYIAAGALRAIPFDLNRLETRGSAVSMLPLVSTTAAGGGDLVVANDGTLAYVDATTNARTLVWVDRTGREETIIATPGAYLQPRLSPDGTRVAIWNNDQANDILIWDLERRTLTPLTLDPGEDQHPLWTADSRRIIFSSNRSGHFNLWWQAADGTGTAEQLTTSSQPEFPTGIAPDGASVVFFKNLGSTGRDLLRLALDGTRKVTLLLQTTFDEREGTVSPDGRWLAYESTMTGSNEVYVRPFPNVSGGRWRVSTAGGSRALWARDGKELFYVGVDGSLFRVPVETKGATWDNRAPVKVFERRYFVGGNSGRSYDVSPDGQRFLMIKGSGTEASGVSPALVLVQHWDEELKRLAPK